MKVWIRLAFALLFVLGSSAPLLADSTVTFPTSPLDITFTATSGLIDTATGFIPALLNGSGWVQPATGISVPTPPSPMTDLPWDGPAYLVNAGQFYFNGETFNLVPANRPGYWFTHPLQGVWGDDLIFPTAGPEDKLDGAGLAFLAADGSGHWITIGEWPGADPSLGYYIEEGSADPRGRGIYSGYGQFTLTPEPSSLVLLATGIFGVCASLRRQLAPRSS